MRATKTLRRPAYWAKYRKGLMNPDPNALEPMRLQEWEKRALELDELHVALNHQEYYLRQALKAGTVAEMRKLIRVALSTPEE